MASPHGPGHNTQSDSAIIPTSLPDQGSSTAGLPLELKDKEANDREEIANVVATSNRAERDAFIVWRAKVKSLTAEQRREFLSHKHHDLASYVAEFEDIARRQGRRRAHRIATLIKPLWDLCKVLAPIASDPWLSHLDPSHSSLVLGGVAYLLSFSGRFLDYYDRILDCLASMLERLPLVDKLEALHTIRQEDDLRNAAVNVCADVLQFCIEASNLFVDEHGKVKGSARLLLASMWSSFEAKFGKLSKDFERHVKLLETYAQLASAQRQEKFMRDREKRDILEDRETFRRIKHEEQLKLTELIRLQEAKRLLILERIPAISLQSVQDDRLERCLEGTGQWLLDNDEFQSWESSSETKLLWVHGKHGCGKSYLAARVIDHLAKTQAHDGKVALSYSYCNPIDASNAARNTGASNENSAMIDLDQLIGTLLKQLLRYLPVSESLPSLEHAAGSKDDARPTREQMKTAIIEALSKLQKAFVVIDGLDECHKLGNPHFAKFCDFISSLLHSSLAPTATKIIVFSRPNYSEIESAFAGATSIQVDGGANSEDIKLFINTKISGLKVSESILQEITRKMVSRSDGMFLWVDLVSGSLQGERNVRGIRRAIEELPEGLDTVYEWSMARILRQPNRAARERALNLLLWTTNALRPLSREEMMEALAVESDMTELDEEARLVSDDGFITECADLIVLRDGYYQLLHTSLKEYLEATSESTSPPLKTYASMQARAQEILAEICLTYLNFKTFEKGPVATEEDFDQFLKENPFFRYASLNWGKHLDRAKRRDLAELAIKFVSSESARDISLQHIFKDQDWIVPWRRIRNPFPFRRGSTPMHLLAIFNLRSVADMVPAFWPFIYSKDGYNNRPFKYAIMNGSNDICHFILDLGQVPAMRTFVGGEPVFLCEDALHCAAYLDWPYVVERLVQIGVDKSVAAGSWDTPLHVAALKGSSLALKALLQGGVDPNKTNEEKQTPLTLAARANYADVVEVLVNNGADVSICSGPQDKTALQIAAKNGNIKIAKLVLEHGADVNARDNWVGPAINYAVKGGHVGLAKMLIHEYKADLGIPSCSGANLLHLAASSGRCDLVSLLLDLGVLPVVTEELGDNILHHAVGARSLDMLPMLLERFPELDLRVTNKAGENPMHIAAEFGFLESVQFLLKLDPYLATMVSASAGLPLHTAARHGKVDCAHALTTPENVDIEDLQGRTPLIEAAISGHFSVVKCLVERGADVNKVDVDGRSALLAAACNGHLPVVEYLVEHGADINRTDKWNRGLLLHLLSNGHFAAAETLLQRGVEVNVVTDSGVTPLLVAARMNCTRETSRLLDLGADFKHRWKEDGQTAFMRAVSFQRASTVELFERRGIANYGEVDNELLSAVQWAVLRDNMPMVEKFLAKDKTLALGLDALGADCMSTAAGYGSESMIPFLLNLGIGPEGLGKHYQGLTPLMRAAENGHATCVEMLLKAGADVGKVDGAPWYRNAGHRAACCGFPRITKILLQAGVDAMTRDALGYSVADYVNMFPKVRKKTRRLLEQGPRPKDDVVLPILRKTIVDCASATLSLDSTLIENKEWELSNTTRPAEATLTEFLRQSYIACLGLALKRFLNLSPVPEHQQWSTLGVHQGPAHNPSSSPASSIFTSSQVDYILADACLCFSEVIHSNYLLSYGVWWSRCWICNNRTNSTFMCRTCSEIFLCIDCHANYIKSGRRTPESFQALQRLEKEAGPVMVALESLRRNVKLLVESLAALPEVEEWIVQMHASYNKWNNIFNEFGPFETERFTGWNFTEIVSRALAPRQESFDTIRPAKSEEKKPLEPHTHGMEDFDNEDKWIALGNDLIDNFAVTYGAELYGEWAGKMDCCRGHEFIEFPAWSELGDDQTANFDEHKRLKSEFFQNLLLRYTLEHPEKPSPKLDTNRQGEKWADEPHEQSRAEVNLTETTTKRPDEHPSWPSSPDGNSKESAQSYTPINSQSGLDYEGGTGNKSKGEGVEANDESDGWDTDDDGESVSSMDSQSLDSILFDVEARITDNPAAELPEVIAKAIRFVIESKDRDRDSLLAKRLVSRLVKNAGQWPPAQA